MRRMNNSSPHHSILTQVDTKCVLIDASGYGDDKGTHVSVFIKLLAGHYDYQTSLALLRTVTYELLNQLEDRI